LRRYACWPPTLQPKICWSGSSQTPARSQRSRWRARSPCSRSIPRSFERQARRIVLDDDEDDQLRALSLNALTYFGNPATQSEDDELARRVESLNSQSRSRSVKKAAAGYLAKRGR